MESLITHPMINWSSFTQSCYVNRAVGFSIDFSCMQLPENALSSFSEKWSRALSDMAALEAGSIANPDENRRVGHYWLRAPQLAPEPELASAIEETLAAVDEISRKVHTAELQGRDGPFTDLLIIGIGGSALGPQFVTEALGNPGEDRMRLHFFDNTDPDGIDRTLARLRGRLGQTLAIVISKSGGTPETRNGMLEAVQAFLSEGIEFASQAIAVTGEGSKLDQVASSEGWLARFPMWDWVGGRTSELAAVGLLPAALQGLDIHGMLEGAARMDELTRNPDLARNPAGLLALNWYHATNGKGEKDMVILPYKDRLMLFSRYLQQLIMESLGKATDLDGNPVEQGIAVYGNKGSTDQHAYVQQLREGVHNFFVTFIEVKSDRQGASIEVEPETTTGDYLNAFFLGTRTALLENGRRSLTLTIEEVTPQTVGMLIALYERAVSFYASFVNINAYHQPGVEAGKKAAARFLELKKKALKALKAAPDSAFTAPQLAEKIGEPDNSVAIYKLLDHAAANPAKGITRILAESPLDDAFKAV